MNKYLQNVPAERVVKSSNSILSVLKKMDSLLKKLLIVYDENNSYLGLVSMGDVQRAIIKDISLDTPVYKIIRERNLVANTNVSFATIKNLMIEYRMEFMPVINEKKDLVGVYLWEDIFPVKKQLPEKQIDIPVVVMAGGKGTRLKPLTNVIPKPLIPIGNNTILETILDKFNEIGCSRFFLSVNYKSEIIEYYLKNLNNPKYNIEYLKEDKPLGTAGSMYLLKGKMNSTFFVTNCDIIIEEDYTQIFQYHKDNGNELTIVAALLHYPIPYGTIETGENGLLTSIQEKPEIVFKINSGMYILEPHLLNEIPDQQHFHITELISAVIKRNGKVGVYPVSEKAWIDIGEWDKYYSIIRENQ